MAAVSKPFDLQGREVVVSVSIGIVMSDGALRAGRRHGPRRGHRDVSREGARQGTLRDLRHARCSRRPRNGCTSSPICGARSSGRSCGCTISRSSRSSGQQLCGFEALVRWQHPTRGLVPPNGFIPIAEETGLIVPIGRWVLEEACRQMRAWDDEFPECANLMVNVNLSARQCLHPDLVADVARVLAETGLRRRRLKLEITESLVLEGSEAVIDILTKLRALGVQLGLDDFGMGYSALSYLQRLPVQSLKIDRVVRQRHAELRQPRDHPGDSVDGGSALTMDVTAEGVETADQAAMLTTLECEFGQGFYFDKPLTQDAAREVLRRHQSGVAARCVA